MKRFAFVALPLVIVAGCSSVGAFQPWPVHVRQAPKPPTPLRAPAGQALVVVIQSTPPGAGNGAYTTFVPGTPIAQFDNETPSWTVKAIAPGTHRFYVRTWTSDFCIRLDANLSPGKVYLLDLSPEYADNTSTGPATFRDQPLPGPLAHFSYIAVDAAAAAKELASHAEQAKECMRHADASFAKSPTVPITVGFDEIDFAVRAE